MSTGSSDRAAIIAKRSVSLSKTYPIIGIFMALLGLFISSLSGTVNNLSSSAPTGNLTSAANLDLSKSLPLIAVPLQALAAIIFATPVLLLFVYDKNNGVLEYFLSLGMSQKDIYSQYLKATLYLSLVVVAFAVAIDLVAGVLLGTNGVMLEVAALVVAMALPAVTFGTLLMISFSSLQKQRVGSNQPLGMTIGVFTVMPAYLIPLVVPSLALEGDLLLAAAIIGLSLLTFTVSGRLISREKLLP